MFHHDARHTGSSQSNAPNTNHSIWKLSLEKEITSAITIFENKIYLGSVDKKVYCIDALGDGSGATKIIWTFLTNGIIRSTPAIANGKLYVGSEDKYLYCLDATGNDNGTTTLFWKYQCGDSIVSSPVVTDRFVFIGSSDKKIYCFNATTGDIVWSYQTGGNIKSSPAVDNDRLIVLADNKRLFCFDADPSDGIDEGVDDPDNASYDLIWRKTLSVTIFSAEPSPIIYNEKIYLGTGFRLFSFDLQTGNILWQVTDLPITITRTPTIYQNRLYVTTFSDKNQTLCFDSDPFDDGIDEGIPDPEECEYDLIWIYDTQTGNTVMSSPISADGKIYFGSRDSFMYCLNASDKSLIWKYKTKDPIETSSPAIAQKVLVFSSNTTLYCFADNSPPYKPQTPGGPTIGFTNYEYQYTASTEDPDHDQLWYNFSWGDGTSSGWIGPVAQNTPISATHSWKNPGTFYVRAKAKDQYETSQSSERLKVIIVDPPNLNIDSVTGGKGVSININNTGNGPATNVTVSIHITGGVFVYPRNTSIFLNMIGSHEEIDVIVSIFGFGLGLCTPLPIITITVTCDQGITTNKTVNAQILFNTVRIK
ncbi:MAG: PQQ-binding-like beta-propeller repeat protein [Candidatus Thermoplasmatota archaeon]